MRCGAEVAAIRAAPQDDAEQVTQALRGEPLEVEERQGGWARVATAYGYPGWVREDALCGDDPLALAWTFVGAPYEWGGLTVAGIDCSGLVHIAYRLAGRLVPRDSWQQEGAGAEVAEPELRPGDLVTYGSEARADHIAFWVGDGRILHSRGGVGVVEEAEPDELRARRRRTIRL
jgi:gamma-D-glutamyl-L-lysine dipeptidyl-peptidase